MAVRSRHDAANDDVTPPRSSTGPVELGIRVPPESDTFVDTKVEASPGAQIFRLAGDYWAVTFAALSVLLRDAKGMHYLAHLLVRPGQPVAVGELARIGAPVVWRQAADESAATLERRRSAVTKRIHAAIKHITSHHGALGDHLSNCVRTGYVCIYAPPKPSVEWLV